MLSFGIVIFFLCEKKKGFEHVLAILFSTTYPNFQRSSNSVHAFPRNPVETSNLMELMIPIEHLFKWIQLFCYFELASFFVFYSILFHYQLSNGKKMEKFICLKKYFPRDWICYICNVKSHLNLIVTCRGWHRFVNISFCKIFHFFFK